MSKSADAPLPGGLLTLREAAAFLRVHPRTVRTYVRRGLLSGRLIGRQWRFRLKDLDTLFENAPTRWDWGESPEAEE
jgi:excisionase family DNA binding protein